MTIDLSRIKEAARTDVFGEPEKQSVEVMASDIQALVAVVEAAQDYMQNKSTQFSDIENKLRALTASLQPFTNGGDTNG